MEKHVISLPPRVNMDTSITHITKKKGTIMTEPCVVGSQAGLSASEIHPA